MTSFGIGALQGFVQSERTLWIVHVIHIENDGQNMVSDSYLVTGVRLKHGHKVSGSTKKCYSLSLMNILR